MVECRFIFSLTSLWDEQRVAKRQGGKMYKNSSKFSNRETIWTTKIHSKWKIHFDRNYRFVYWITDEMSTVWCDDSAFKELKHQILYTSIRLTIIWGGSSNAASVQMLTAVKFTKVKIKHEIILKILSKSPASYIISLKTLIANL